MVTILSSCRNIITDEKELVKVFNNHYINIVKNSYGKETMHIARDNNIDNINLAIELITKTIQTFVKLKSNTVIIKPQCPLYF